MSETARSVQRRCTKYAFDGKFTQLVRSPPFWRRDAARGEFKSTNTVDLNNGASSPRISRSSECRAVDHMIRDATTRVFAPEDKLHINPIGSSPLTVADLARVLNLFSVVPAAFSMRLTEPDLTVTMRYGKLAADKPDSAVDDLLAAWNARMAECIQTMKGHTSGVISVAFLPDGTMVTGSWDGTTKLWDKRGVCKESMEHGGKVRCIAVSPDGSTIASSGDNHKIKLWSKRGRLVKTLEGHTNNVNSLAFSRDGKTLVSGSFDKTVRSWDVATGEYRTMEGHSNWVLSVAVSPDGKTIVSGSRDMTIKVWDAESGRLEQTLEGHTDSVNAVAISPDGALLASGSWDKTIRLWDTRTWECVAVLRGHASFVSSVAFSPDGRTLASGSDDNTVKLWSIGSGECFETLRGHDDWVNSVVFSPDGSTLLSGSDDKTAKQWHIKHSPEIEEVCAQPTLGADIRLPSDDSPLYLADLAWVVIHILATGLPRSFEMRMAHPPVAVSMYDGLFFETPTNSEVRGLLAPLNQSRLNKLVAQACADAGIALPAASTAVMDPNGFISVSPADDKIAAALLPLNRSCLTAAVARVCAQAVTAKTAIRVTHADLFTLKKLLAHVKATGIAPRSFEVQLDDPAATVTLGPTGFEVAPPSDVVDFVVSGFSFLTAYLDAISTADEISLGEHAPLTIGDLNVALAILTERKVAPRSFEMRLADPAGVVHTDQDGFLLSSPAGFSADVVQAVEPLNRIRLAASVSAACAQPVTPDAAVRLVHADLPSLQQVLSHIELAGIAPRSFEVQLDDPAATVTLGPTGFEVAPPSDVVDFVVSGFSFLTAYLDAISTADEISLGEHAPLTIGDLNVALAILTERKVAPRSFEMRLADPAGVVHTDQDGFLLSSPAGFSADVVQAVEPLNRIRLAASVSAACAQPVTPDAAVRLVHADLPSLQQVLSHIELAGIAPRSFEVQLDDPAATVTLGPTGFEVAPPNQAVAEVLSGFSFLTAHLDAISTDDEISLGEHAPLTAEDFRAALSRLAGRRIAPRSFEMKLSKPKMVVKLNAEKFLIARGEATGGPVTAIMYKFNQAIFRHKINEFCAQPVTAESDVDFGFDKASALILKITLGDLSRVVDHILSCHVLPRSFTMQLRSPQCTIQLNNDGFFCPSVPKSAVHDIIDPLNRICLDAILDGRLSRPVNSKTELRYMFPSYVPTDARDLRRVLDHATAGDKLPRVFQMKVNRPETTVSLGPRGFTSTHANSVVNAVLKQVNALPVVARLVKVHDAERMLSDADDAIFSLANLESAKALLDKANVLLAAAGPHATQHEARVLALRTGLARLQPVQALAKDPMPALRGRVKEALERSDELHAHIISGDVGKMRSRKLLRDKLFSPVVLNCLDRERRSPLHSAFVHDQPQAFAALLKAGCLLDDAFPDGHPLLAAVAKPPMLAAMLAARVDIDTVSRNTTALVVAIQGGHWDSATKLLARGADPSSRRSASTRCRPSRAWPTRIWPA
ncbi:tyrosine kinase [Carpediemonas membranifera]|uniref:Tyrosine kinase n=1 Tax=Carpediemonas membranifera TaxID=201153 RepID=A0A8J6E6E3_9EUKA|nr:tyrosine kinase [Carpediemonas membranifera]|eukprot:KAG9397012.1 tyrosine kinase [Carpediemonas membranifera]